MKGVLIRSGFHCLNQELRLRRAKSAETKTGIVFVQLPVFHMNNGESFVGLMAEWDDLVKDDDQFEFRIKAKSLVDDNTHFFPFTRTFGAVVSPSGVCFMSWRWFELNTAVKTAVNYEDLVLPAQREQLRKEIYRLASSDDPLENGEIVSFRRNLKG